MDRLFAKGVNGTAVSIKQYALARWQCTSPTPDANAPSTLVGKKHRPLHAAQPCSTDWRVALL